VPTRTGSGLSLFVIRRSDDPDGAAATLGIAAAKSAVQMMQEARLPYIVVLTHPTTGGVTASYAMLGDIHLAEPGALIGFAGPRVIEQTIREKLPEGFQRAEFLKEKGMVDIVAPRAELRQALSSIIRVLMKKGARGAVSNGYSSVLDRAAE